VVYHRQDLHSSLFHAATSSDLPGRPAEILTGKKVVSCDPWQGTISCEDGERFHGSIIIGADGIRSSIRGCVSGEERNAIPTGIAAYRLLLSMEVLSGIGSIPPEVLDVENSTTTMVMGHDRRAIMGPGRGGELFGIVALVPDENVQEPVTESWVAEGSVGALLDAFAEFPTWVKDMFRCASDVALWQLRDIEPFDNWVCGRAILIGDAAHAMLPTQGQGASQSIEDAEALQAFLSDLPLSPTANEVNRALNQVLEARYERATLIQKYSRQQARPVDNPGLTYKQLNPAEFMEYNCNYDGAKSWRAKIKSTGKPNP
jgi:salicylate hydroxylase